MAAAEVLPLIFSFPPDELETASPKAYESCITKYVQDLSRTSPSIWTKPVDKQNILDLMNPAVNTLPYMLALRAQISAAGKDKTRSEELLNRAILFFTSFDPVQVRYDHELFGVLLGWLFESVKSTSSAQMAILSTAMLRLDPTGGTFTTFHLLLVRACLESGVPSQALPILDKNIYAFPQFPAKHVPEELMSEELEFSNSFILPRTGFTGKVSIEHVLEYYLLGAHIYIGLRNYRRARLFLEYILLTPTQQYTTSALQVEAYKKWLLVGLLAHGKAYSIPRTLDQPILRCIRGASKAYEALADDFEKRDAKKFRAELDTGMQIWHEDGNLRLVKEVAEALVRYRIIDLQKTYVALPVQRVASYLEFPADHTLEILTDMIRLGHLGASISPASSGSAEAVLRFHDATLATSDIVLKDTELEAQTKRIEDLVTFIRDADRRLQLTKEYVEHQKRVKRATGGPDGDLADQMDLSWDASAAPIIEDGDEDIMAS